jgi:hypothetical protein
VAVNITIIAHWNVTLRNLVERKQSTKLRALIYQKTVYVHEMFAVEFSPGLTSSLAMQGKLNTFSRTQ